MEKEAVSNEMPKGSKDTPMTGIFIGFPINSEIAYELGKSSAWKDALITRYEHPEEIQEIIFQDKKYIGRYIQKTNVSIKEIETEEKMIRARLSDFISHQKGDLLQLQIIAQLFLY